jgi:hypothetical protein
MHHNTPTRSIGRTGPAVFPIGLGCVGDGVLRGRYFRARVFPGRLRGRCDR